MDHQGAQTVLRAKGLRATPQRLAILKAMYAKHQPRSVEDIHAKVKGDLVTVYRTLQSFVSAGLAREVRFKDAAVRYEAATHHHHHHVVCTSCGTIDELPSCDMHSIEKQVLSTSKNFAAITEHSLEFFGTCTTCAKR